MIRNFKIFEDYKRSRKIKDKLSKQFDEEFVDEFWEEHFMRDAKEIIELWPSSIWQHIDDDEYISDLIDDEKSQLGIEDFGEYEYKNYIENNISDKKEKKVLQLFNKKIKNKEDKEEYYDSSMLDDLTEKQLKKIIEDVNEEEEFVEYAVRDRYEGKSAQDVADEYGYSDDGEELYKMFYNYIDDDEVESSYLDEKGYSDKIEDIKEEIYRNTELQQKLLDIKKSNALLLAELYLEDKDEDNIYSNYDFQKAYIKHYAKQHSDNPDARAEALKFLYDNFGLDRFLEDKYSDDMWLVNSSKYNM